MRSCRNFSKASPSSTLSLAGPEKSMKKLLPLAEAFEAPAPTTLFVFVTAIFFECMRPTGLDQQSVRRRSNIGGCRTTNPLCLLTRDQFVLRFHVAPHARCNFLSPFRTLPAWFVISWRTTQSEKKNRWVSLVRESRVHCVIASVATTSRGLVSVAA